MIKSIKLLIQTKKSLKEENEKLRQEVEEWKNKYKQLDKEYEDEVWELTNGCKNQSTLQKINIPLAESYKKSVCDILSYFNYPMSPDEIVEEMEKETTNLDHDSVLLAIQLLLQDRNLILTVDRKVKLRIY